MKDWKQDELIAEGYEIWNAKITSADLDMSDHGCIIMWLSLDGGGKGVCYGGYCLGNGYVGAKEFRASDKAMVYVMRIMDVIGVDKFSQLKGQYVRVASKGWGESVKIIGNIIENKWFDAESFFTEDDSNTDWHDIPVCDMTKQQLRQAVRDLRKILAEKIDKETDGMGYTE